MVHVVDTHALLWYLEDYEELGRRAGEILGDSAARLIVPTIVLAEARFITAKQKVALSWDQVIAAVSSDERFTAYPLTLDVLHRLSPDMEMHDAIVCATAVLVAESTSEGVQVITKDRAIAGSGLVETVW